jgi:predicted AlkP superfamily pyrophosphatase or phosphodiesterase
MKALFFPDYNHSIMNVSNSILKHYNAKPPHSTNPDIDEILAKGFRNIVYILIDGLGDLNLKHHLPKTSLLRNHQIDTITSVFPSTTVAATTSVLSGLSPIETGWLGWCQYVKEERKNVVFFTNKDYYDENTVFSYDVAKKYVDYPSLYHLIEDASPDVTTHEIFPAFRTPKHDSFYKQCETILDTIKEPGRHFIYTYWDKVDYNMHEYGPNSSVVHQQITQVETAYQYLINEMPEDTVVIMLADHGQVEVSPIDLHQYQNLWDMFLHEPSIESRATTFFIKENKHKEFVSTFNELFREKFVLYQTKDLLRLNLFGYGTPHAKFYEFLGEYIAIAIDHYYFSMNKGPFVMKGQHASLLEEEVRVPLIVGHKKKA